MALKPEQVFTPRNKAVNTQLYIDRPEIEKALKRAMRSSYHIFIHGDSGTGKSWLYKQTLKRNETKYLVANCANASRFGSLTKELLQATGVTAEHTGYEESKEASLGVSKTGATLAHSKSYVIHEDLLLKCFEEFRKEAGSKAAFFVLDNLEAIFMNEKVMKELADILILLDDDRYAKLNIRLILVGTPPDVVQYFHNTHHLSTIANRIREIPEVSKFAKHQVDALVKRGFCDLLGLRLSNDVLTLWQHHIGRVTLAIPQRVQEYCLQLAFAAEDKLQDPSVELLDIADKDWLGTDFNHCYATLTSAMDFRGSAQPRMTQLIYSLSNLKSRTFHVDTVKKQMAKDFPRTIDGKTVAVKRLLNRLAGQEDPIVKQSSRGEEYSFTDLRFPMALRLFTRKDENEAVCHRFMDHDYTS